MQIWSKDLFDDAVLYDPVGKLIAKHFNVGNAFGMNQLIVCINLTLSTINKLVQKSTEAVIC